MKRLWILLLAVLPGCTGNDSINRTPNSSQSTLTIAVQTRSPSGSHLYKTKSTDWNQIIFRLTGSDMDTLLDTLPTKPGSAPILHNLTDIPPGPSRKLTVWTTNSLSGKTIHTPKDTLLSISAGTTSLVSLTLLPSMGSLVFRFSEIDGAVDTVSCLFATATDTFRIQSGTFSRDGLSLSLDYLPNLSQGLLKVFAFTSTYDTLYRFEQLLQFNAQADSTIYALFSQADGALSLTTQLVQPGTTIISGAINNKCDTSESGPILIREYMTVGGLDYIEMYNPESYDITLDTMYVHGNSADKKLLNVSIPSLGSYVVSITPAAYADTTIASLSLLNAGEEFIMLKDKRKKVMDKVYIPKLSASLKSSMELLPGFTSPASNNFDTHWAPTTKAIGTSGYFGTPGE